MHPHFEQLTHRMAKRPLIMGILNVTPDSFSDGGLWMDPRTAADHARDMADAGADIVDIGGESTRPGAPEVPLQVELDRVIPALRTLRAKYPALPVSVDTQKAEVARQALAEAPA